MTSALLIGSLNKINIGGKDEFFANKDLSIPSLNVNRALDPNKRYYLIIECEFIRNFSYKSATQGRGIFINDIHFKTIVAADRGALGNKFRWEGYVQGSRIKQVNLDRSWTYQPTSQSHTKTTKFELYWN
ncbi:TPA: hypothetical protein R8J12_001772 [Campylobacter jejuni]|nr:hypothetical protein [Campylobacter jejuni]